MPVVYFVATGVISKMEILMIKHIIPIIFFYYLNAFSNDIVISEEPVSVKECVGNVASLSVSAYSISDNALSFQWYKDNLLIVGANSTLLNFSALQHSQSGTYYCQISNNENEKIKTNSVSVYALRPTSITKQPEDVLTNLASDIITLSFEAHVSGLDIQEATQSGEFVKVQWFRVNDNDNIKLNNDEIYNGVISNKLSINTAKLPDTTFYFAEIEGKCGIAKTKIVKVVKNLNLVLLKIADLDACEGNIESLKATITNPQNHKLEFQWYKDGKPIYYKENLKGIYSDELIFNPIYMKDAGKYKLEAKIKEMNYSTFSNEVVVAVSKAPEIFCIRINSKNHTLKIENLALNVFYKESSDSNYIDIYKDGELISTYTPSMLSWYRYDFNNIRALNYVILKSDKYAKYWAIIRNECGQSVSDTVSVDEDLDGFNNCDPWNQYHFLCEGDSVAFELNYRRKSKILPTYRWDSDIRDESWWSGDIITNKNKLIISSLKRGHTGRYNLWTHIKDESFMSIDFNIIVKGPPKISAQPKDYTLISGNTETIFIIGIYTYIADTNLTSLYYMPFIGTTPTLLEKTIASFTGDYKYVKRVSKADEGYYYAVLSNGYCGYTVTDTVKVNVIPKGSTGVSYSESKSGMIIQPNPASDFITIQIQTSDVFKTSDVYNVQIFDVLGIEIKNLTPALSMNGEGVRIDVSKLPAGVYFIRIGDKVDKFLKV